MWMVYDTASGDIIFHEQREKAQKDYEDAIEGLKEDVGESKVYLLKVEKSQTIVNYPED
ncbi:hypothetical protein [Sporosarcina globispora]|uniref:hypothetical protein n=1 Tax=Sporosarcina globispora TaxID=1459 RepID=UPI000B21AD26|nr:hypothetical protein [Sporosarcina globispora]